MLMRRRRLAGLADAKDERGTRGIEVVLTVYPSFVCTKKWSAMRLINERK
jgi:hypothetical protein